MVSRVESAAKHSLQWVALCVIGAMQPARPASVRPRTTAIHVASLCIWGSYSVGPIDLPKIMTHPEFH
jgi:hypothetical protein